MLTVNYENEMNLKKLPEKKAAFLRRLICTNIVVHEMLTETSSYR